LLRNVKFIDRFVETRTKAKIELNANPYQSKVLYPSVFRDLDFKTIDKLCKMNKEFEKFIEQTEKLMTASENMFQEQKKNWTNFVTATLQTTQKLKVIAKTNIYLQTKNNHWL
jgi:hypothetical protein